MEAHSNSRWKSRTLFRIQIALVIMQALALAPLAPGAAAAEAPAPRQVKPVLVSSIPGFSRGAPIPSHVVGNILFMKGSSAVDFTDLNAMKMIAAPADFGPRIYDGNRFYVLEDSPGKVRIFDNSNPDRPINIGALDLPIETAVVKEGILYGITFETRDLVIMDLSDVSNPTTLAEVPTGTVTANSLAGPDANGRLYYTSSSNGSTRLDVYDVRDPANPIWENGINPPAQQFVLQGDYLYGVGKTGLKIYSLTNTPTLELVGNYKPTSNYFTLAAPGGNYVYLPETNGVSVVNVSNPTNPTAVATLPMLAEGFLVKDNTIFVTGGNGVQAWDITDPANPQAYPKAQPSWEGYVKTWDVQVRGNHAFTVDSSLANAGLDTMFRIYDISNPDHPTLVSSLKTANYTTDLKLFGDRVYLPGYPRSDIIDISSLESPKHLGSVPGGPSTTGLTFNSRYTFSTVFTPTGKMLKVNDASPAATELGRIAVNITIPQSLQVSEEFAAMQTELGVQIIDIRDPKNMNDLGVLPGKVFDLKGSLLLLKEDTTVSVYQLGTSGSYELLGSFNVPANAIAKRYSDPARVGVIAGSSPQDHVLQVYNLIDPTAPFLELEVFGAPDPAPSGPYPEPWFGQAIQGDLLFNAGQDDGFQIFKLVPMQGETITDDFSGGNDDGWFRWSPFADFGAPATFTVADGSYTIASPKSPAPQILYTYAGATRVDKNFTDAQVQADVTAWLDGNGDSPTIELLVRGESHPGLVANWYAAEFSPEPTPGAGAAGFSEHPNLAIVRVIRSVPVTLAQQTFADDFFSATKTYTVSLEANGPLITARLFEKTAEDPVFISELQAIDTQLDHGFVGINILDRMGLVGKGNNPVQITFDNFSANGYTEAPTIRIDATGTVYWSIGATQAGYVLESAQTVTGPFTPVTEPLIKSSNPLINMFKPAEMGAALFYRLSRN